MKIPVIAATVLVLGACASPTPPSTIGAKKATVPLELAEPLLQLAEKAYIRHDYASAVEIWQDLATKGNATAQFRMGFLFTNGEITRPRPKQANRWLRPAADQNHPHAQMLLGSSYAWADGRFRDLGRAEYWFRRAARSNDPFIVRMIGSYYQVAQNAAADARAVPWFERAAALGSVGALVDLGRVYREGRGASKNLTKALGLFRRAAAQGDADAHGDLGDMYLKGEGLAIDYAMALKHLTFAGQHGLPNAQFQLGVLYRDGLGTDRDSDSAREWFEKSANNNNADAAFSLSAMYLGRELNVPNGIDQAYSWFVQGLRAQGLNPSVLIHQKLKLPRPG
jgi:uncharacterized protein